MICLKNNHNEADFASFVTRWFSTLMTIFGHQDGIASHNNTRYE